MKNLSIWLRFPDYCHNINVMFCPKTTAMRKTLFILLVALFSLVSCKNKTGNNSVVGKWKPTEVNIKDINDEEKKNIIENTTIELTHNGKFIKVIKNDKMTMPYNETGTYTYNEKEHTITVTNSDSPDKSEKYTIKWEDSKMVITGEEGTMKLKRE